MRMGKVQSKLYIKASLFLVENWTYRSHQGPEVTSLRVISKANPTKTDVVFLQADTSYQSSEGNSQKESSERNSWTWSWTFRLLTPSSLPLWGLQWPSKSTLAVGFHLLMSSVKKKKKNMLETLLCRHKLNLKSFDKGPTYSPLIAKLSGEKEPFHTSFSPSNSKVSCLGRLYLVWRSYCTSHFLIFHFSHQ